MQTYRGTSRAKRYKPNQQDRCTYSSRVQNSSRSHRTSSRDQPGQAIPPTAVASRQSWRSRYTLSIGSTTTIHINHVHLIFMSCLVSTNCLPPPAADEGTRPSSARSSRLFLYICQSVLHICQFLFIFVNIFF